MIRKALLIAVLLAGIALIAIVQFSVPTLFGADGYLHIRMASFIREFGVNYHFHWARFSVFFDRFSDKDFLYHVTMIPFTFFKDIFFGAKVAAVCWAVVLFLVFFLILRKYSLPALVPWTLVTFFLSSGFLQAISRPRPMVVMILLTILFVHSSIRRARWELFFISLVYSLTHVSSPLLLVFILMAESVRRVSDGIFDVRTIGAVTLGVIAGFLLHPNFPNNFLVFYLNGILVPLFALKWGLELGAEFFPLTTREFILEYPWIFIVLGLCAIAALSNQMRPRTSTKIWASIAGFFLIGAFFSRRYILHSYPVVLIAGASYVRDWWSSAERLVWLRRRRAVCWAGGAFVCAVIAASGYSTSRQFQSVRELEVAYNSHYEDVGRWMNEYIPAGETVFHANWSDSQFFIGLSPEHDYFVTLDPIYMYYWDPEKYKVYRQIAFGQHPDPYTALRSTFGVTYGYAGKNYFGGLVEQIRQDRRFTIMAENQLAAVFRLN